MMPSAARARSVVKLARIELEQHHFVQPRSLADHLAPGILRPGAHRRAAGLQVTGLDDGAGMLALGVNKQIGLLRPVTAAWRVAFGSCRCGTCQARASGERREQQRTPRGSAAR